MEWRNLIFGWSGTFWRALKMDITTWCLAVIGYPHYERHSGSAFFIKDVVALTLNDVRDFQFTPADDLKWPHWDFKVNCESETEWFLYENVEIVTPGTAVVPLNANRNSDKTPGMVWKSIDNSSLANANSDTVVSGATQLCHGIIGSGKDAGSLTHDEEIILKKGTPYCLRYIASSAGYVDYLFDWYEHQNKT